MCWKICCFQAVQKPQRVFPLHQMIKQIIQDEWDLPGASLRGTRIMTCLYPLPEQEKLLSPKVDAAVSAMTKKTMVPVEGSTALNVQDRKFDTLLKQTFDINALTLQASVCSQGLPAMGTGNSGAGRGIPGACCSISKTGVRCCISGGCLL